MAEVEIAPMRQETARVEKKVRPQDLSWKYILVQKAHIAWDQSAVSQSLQLWGRGDPWSEVNDASLV